MGIRTNYLHLLSDRDRLFMLGEIYLDGSYEHGLEVHEYDDKSENLHTALSHLSRIFWEVS